MPVGVSDIDFIQRIVPHYDEKTNTTFIKSYHATHPSKPEVKGVIRLLNIIIYLVIMEYQGEI